MEKFIGRYGDFIKVYDVLSVTFWVAIDWEEIHKNQMQ